MRPAWFSNPASVLTDARIELALEQHVTDHPPIARDGVQRQHTRARQLLARAVAVEAAEQLVAAAHGQGRGARRDGIRDSRAASSEIGGDQRLLAILTAADVEEIDLAGVGVARLDRLDLELKATPARRAPPARRCSRDRRRCSDTPGYRCPTTIRSAALTLLAPSTAARARGA